MELANFPSCCGARILHNFFNGDLDSTRINSLITDAKSNKVGMIIAITSNREGRQQKAAALLEARGFQKVVHNTNPNTNRQTMLWILDLTEKPKTAAMPQRLASKSNQQNISEKRVSQVLRRRESAPPIPRGEED